jgi:hypothetical protein
VLLHVRVSVLAVYLLFILLLVINPIVMFLVDSVWKTKAAGIETIYPTLETLCRPTYSTNTIAEDGNAKTVSTLPQASRFVVLCCVAATATMRSS